MKNKLKAIDFFCSGGGMTYGITQSGIEVIAGIDIEKDCEETYEKNNPNSKFILADIFKLKESKLKDYIELKNNDDNLIFIGCSPCQYWSIIRTNKKKAEQSKDLLKEFHRFVNYYRPGYVVVENVPGIEKNKKESGLVDFVNDLRNQGYIVKHEIVNLHNFGVPQNRKRFTLIASRVSKDICFPKPTKNKKFLVKDFIGEKNGFPKVQAGYNDTSVFNHTVANLSEKNLKRLQQTPKNGGSWIDWKDDNSLCRDKYKGNSFIDNYGRMSWDKPAPTITTRFLSLSNGRFGHPEEDRAISIREGATLQTFPQDYHFISSGIHKIAKMIGNAVPPAYAKVIGNIIIKEHSKIG